VPTIRALRLRRRAAARWNGFAIRNRSEVAALAVLRDVTPPVALRLERRDVLHPPLLAAFEQVDVRATETLEQDGAGAFVDKFLDGWRQAGSCRS